jgi:hypothetical protein
MVTESQLSDDLRELLEVRVLRREQRVAFEEGNDPIEKVSPVANNQDERSVASAIRSDAPAVEPLTDQFEYLSPVAVLADMELRYELKTVPATRVCVALRPRSFLRRRHTLRCSYPAFPADCPHPSRCHYRKRPVGHQR